MPIHLNMLKKWSLRWSVWTDCWQTSVTVGRHEADSVCACVAVITWCRKCFVIGWHKARAVRTAVTWHKQRRLSKVWKTRTFSTCENFKFTSSNFTLAAFIKGRLRAYSCACIRKLPLEDLTDWDGAVEYISLCLRAVTGTVSTDLILRKNVDKITCLFLHSLHLDQAQQHNRVHIFGLRLGIGWVKLINAAQ